VRDVELYRRPPFFTGDEAAVLRQKRRFRRRRRAVQLLFVGGIVGLAAALSLLKIPDILVGAGSFAALSTAFVVSHLAAGKRAWMSPLEAYEDGLAANEITALFSRRRFVPWKDFDSLELENAGEGAPILRARFGSGRSLESAPGEVDEAAFVKMRERMVRAKEEAQAAKALLESLERAGEPTKSQA
jgi:hypothetical protein